MKRSVLSILLFLSIQGALSSCIQYKCNNQNDTCFAANGNITYVKKCKTEGTECKVQDGLGECKPKETKQSHLYPGFPCTKNEDLEPAIKYV